MCFSMKAPNAPRVAPAPDRANAQGDVAAARRRSSEQQSTYGNIFTSVLGDSSYGTNVQSQRPTVATMGA